MVERARRKFLLAGTAGLAVTALAPLGVLFLAPPAPRRAIAAYLRRSLPGLAVADQELDLFAQAFLNAAGGSAGGLRSALTVMAAPPLFAAMGRRKGIEHWSRAVMTSFLLSTDFFTTAAQQPGKTRYIAFADPYALGCANPLAVKA